MENEKTAKDETIILLNNKLKKLRTIKNSQLKGVQKFIQKKIII